MTIRHRDPWTVKVGDRILHNYYTWTVDKVERTPFDNGTTFHISRDGASTTVTWFDANAEHGDGVPVVVA